MPVKAGSISRNRFLFVSKHPIFPYSEFYRDVSNGEVSAGFISTSQFLIRVILPGILRLKVLSVLFLEGIKFT